MEFLIPQQLDRGFATMFCLMKGVRELPNFQIKGVFLAPF